MVPEKVTGILELELEIYSNVFTKSIAANLKATHSLILDEIPENSSFRDL
ncbi:3474_t:CDS:2 [Entrophospora sp. SA101]|nr:3474_t:CDS:2 [Entrophospora sp. SA101]